MKKVLTYLLVAVIALTFVALLPSVASDNLTPDATNVDNWSGWTDYQGGYRKSATAVLPDGNEGTVFETGCAPDGVNSYGKINNAYVFTGLEPSTNYVLTATVKVDAPAAAYGVDGLIRGVWGNLGLGIGMNLGGAWQSKFFEKDYDGEWHTYQLGIVTPDTVTKDAEYAVVLGTINGEQYITNDIYVQLSSMSLVKFDAGSNLLGVNGSPVLASVAANSGNFVEGSWAGWVDYQGGYRKVSYDAEKGTVIEVGNKSDTYGYSAFSNGILVKGFEASKKYLVTVNAKLTFSGTVDGYGNCTALNGGFLGAAVDFGNSNVQGIYFKSADCGSWKKYEFVVTAPEDASAETAYALAIGGINSPYVEMNTQLLIGDCSIEVMNIPEADPADLLGESGLGNPAYMKANNIGVNAGTWVGHESWNGNQGWDGFQGGSDYGAGVTTRTLVKDTLPDGTEGWVLKVAAPSNIHSGSETAIENIDKICGFEAGKSYIAYVEYKSDHLWCNGHEMYFGIAKNCTHGDQSFVADGKWHTASVKFTYTEEMANATEGAGHYLYIGVCENWISAGDWFEIASVKVFECEDIPEVEDNIISAEAAAFAEGTVVTGGWGDSATATFGLSTETHTMDGTGSAYISLGEKKHQILNLATVSLIGGHTYKLSAWVKTSADFATGGAGGEGATLMWGDNTPTTAWLTGPADWTYVECTFTPDNDGDYPVQLRVWGAMTTAYVDEIAVVDETIIVPAADPDDLLGESGLGNPAYIKANGIGISSGTWVGHEDWNFNQGWDGFTNGATTRTVVKDILPDGTQGWVILISAENGGGAETAIENIDKICGFEAGKSYRVIIEYKTDHAWCNGHELCFGFEKNCTHGDQTFVTDGTWQTFVFDYTYTAEVAETSCGAGHYLYIGACENWWSAGDYLKIASVKVFELDEIPETEGNIIDAEAAAFADGTVVTGGWGDSATATFGLSKESRTMDGTGSAYISLGEKKHQILNLATVSLTGGRTYKLSAWVKTSEDFATGGAGGEGATLMWGDNTPSTAWLTGPADWTYVECTFTPESDKDYPVQLRVWGAMTTAYVDEIAVVDVTPLEDIPVVEDNIIDYEAAAFADGTVVTGGWGDSATAEFGLSKESRTEDGTGSAYISLGEKKHQILNLATVSLIGGHTYRLSAWVKTSEDFATGGAGGEGATLMWGDNTPSTAWLTGPADWTYVECTFTPDNDGDYPVQLRVWGATTAAYVDEIAVVDETIIVPEADPDDLLGESGLGNPAYIKANGIGISSGTWVGHEDWNPNQGWDGFTNDQTTRTVVKDTLPDGSKGWVILISAENGGGAETAIENIDKICGFEVGSSYRVVIEYKTDHAWCNGHELCFGFEKNCTHGDQTFVTDGTWQTFTFDYTYTAEVAETSCGAGHYLYIGACENWWSAGDYLKIASVKVFKIAETVEAGDVEAEVETDKDGNVTINTIQVSEEAEGKIEIDLGAIVTEKDDIDVKVSEDVIDTLIANLEDGESATFKQDDLKVEFDKAALEAIKDSAETGNIEIKLSATVGEEEELLVVNIDIFDGEDKISDFGDGAATITLPFTVDAEKDISLYQIYFVDPETGAYILVDNAVFENGKVTFTTPHNSTYVVLYNYNAPTGDGLAMVLALIAVISFAAVVVLRKREEA